LGLLALLRIPVVLRIIERSIVPTAARHSRTR
jgi:hypothetical protein